MNASPADNLSVKVEENVPAEMRDGTVLRADIYRPTRAGGYPVLMPTSILFRQGHRIRLDIASSDFPNFDRNHNTGNDFWLDTEMQVAHQMVFHDRERLSRLILPVIPR